MKRFLLVCCFVCLVVGCNIKGPELQTDVSGSGLSRIDSQTTESNTTVEESSGTYQQKRQQFQTKLIKKMKSPQEWSDEAPKRFVEVVKYPSGDLQLKASVYIPNKDKSKRRPALVFCHGGFASDNNELLCVGSFLNNYVVMGPSWRGEFGNPGNFEFMFGEVDDAANAVRWLAKQPYVDPDHIYMFGHSIGGGISALVSLMDDVPLRSCGSSGGMYAMIIFPSYNQEGLIPFQYNDAKECQMRILVGNTDYMLRDHYAYIGTDDTPFLPVCRPYQTGKIKAPMLHIENIKGDHFTSFDEAVEQYYKIAEQDRKK